MFEIDTADKLILELVTGLAFGFLPQRGGVTRYRVMTDPHKIGCFGNLKTGRIAATMAG